MKPSLEEIVLRVRTTRKARSPVRLPTCMPSITKSSEKYLANRYKVNTYLRRSVICTRESLCIINDFSSLLLRSLNSNDPLSL